MYALTVFSLSVLSLMLAMANNLNAGKPGNPLGLPVQVDWSVRVAQYVGELSNRNEVRLMQRTNFIKISFCLHF